jgi:hypothetical protein
MVVGQYGLCQFELGTARSMAEGELDSGLRTRMALVRVAAAAAGHGAGLNLAGGGFAASRQRRRRRLGQWAGHGAAAAWE